MRRKYSTFLTVTLIIIIVAVLGLIGFLSYQALSDNRRTAEASEAVDAFTTGDVVTDAPDQSSGETSTEQTNTEGTGDISTDGNGATEGGNGSTSTTSKKPTYKGYNMVGTIVIPKTGVKYPVLEKVTTKTLNIAVGVEWPQPDPELNIKGNVVIAGHNYRNGKFFSNNKKLSNGDKINITDLNKKTVTYVIYKIFETTDNDASFYNRDTNGRREVTLKTCTDDATKRLIIQAREQ